MNAGGNCEPGRTMTGASFTTKCHHKGTVVRLSTELVHGVDNEGISSIISRMRSPRASVVRAEAGVQVINHSVAFTETRGSREIAGKDRCCRQVAADRCLWWHTIKRRRVRHRHTGLNFVRN